MENTKLETPKLGSATNAETAEVQKNKKEESRKVSLESYEKSLYEFSRDKDDSYVNPNDILDFDENIFTMHWKDLENTHSAYLFDQMQSEQTYYKDSFWERRGLTPPKDKRIIVTDRGGTKNYLVKTLKSFWDVTQKAQWSKVDNNYAETAAPRNDGTVDYDVLRSRKDAFNWRR